MKLHQIILLSFICFASVACKLSGESNSSPQMSLYSSPVANGKDTLKITYAGKDDYDYLMDTISVGDTVQFRFVLNAVSNNLVGFSLTRPNDTISTKIILPAESLLDGVFVKASSDYSAGKFTFIAKQNYAYFSFGYVAKAASTNSILQFYLQSDANFGASSTGVNYVSFKLKTPIVGKK
jgi:hypothetical protein